MSVDITERGLLLGTDDSAIQDILIRNEVKTLKKAAASRDKCTRVTYAILGIVGAFGGLASLAVGCVMMPPAGNYLQVAGSLVGFGFAQFCLIKLLFSRLTPDDKELAKELEAMKSMDLATFCTMQHKWQGSSLVIGNLAEYGIIDKALEKNLRDLCKRQLATIEIASKPTPQNATTFAQQITALEAEWTGLRNSIFVQESV